jgi:hypothetical protein
MRFFAPETLSVAAVRVGNDFVRPLESTAETHPQLQPPLLRLPAMISQYFKRDVFIWS